MYVFFVISGFLIAKSYSMQDHLFIYFIARILRIYPALIVAILFCALIVGGLTTTLPKIQYYQDPVILSYIIGNATLLHIQFTLPGVFSNNPYANAVNGSIWTLPLEMTMYIIVALIGILGFFKTRLAANLVIFIGISVFSILYFHFGLLNHRIPIWGITPMLGFFLGVLIFINEDYIPLNFFLGCFLIVISFLLSHSSIHSLIEYITLGYWVFLIAYRLPLQKKWITQYGDFSYGIYIFAFPVQQSLVYYLHIINPWYLFILALPITSILAIFSWYCIEQPALKLKIKVWLALKSLPSDKLLTLLGIHH